MTSRSPGERHPRPETTHRSRAGNVRKVRLGAWQFGFKVSRTPLFPDGHVVVWELNLGYTRYLWGEVY